MKNPQLNERGGLRHLLTIEGLPREILVHVLDTAQSFVGVSGREVKARDARARRGAAACGRLLALCERGVARGARQAVRWMGG